MFLIQHLEQTVSGIKYNEKSKIRINEENKIMEIQCHPMTSGLFVIHAIECYCRYTWNALKSMVRTFVTDGDTQMQYTT